MQVHIYLNSTVNIVLFSLCILAHTCTVCYSSCFTCLLDHLYRVVVIPKEELDKANKDKKRFPSDFKVQFTSTCTL